MDWPQATNTEAAAVEATSTRLEAILAGAARAFSRNGYAATSMRQIAHDTGASLGSIYYHFENKEDILRALICNNFRSVQESLDARLTGVDAPEAELAIFVDNHVRFFADHLDAMRVMSHELDTLGGDAGRQAAELRQRYTRRLLDILGRIRPDLPDVELRIQALCLFGMLNWTYRWFHTVDATIGASGLAARMHDLFLHGFRAAPATSAATI